MLSAKACDVFTYSRERGTYSLTLRERDSEREEGKIAPSESEKHTQHTSAYDSIRQHTSAYACIRQHTLAYVSREREAEAPSERAKPKPKRALSERVGDGSSLISERERR